MEVGLWDWKDGGKREDGGWFMLELSNLTFSRGREQVVEGLGHANRPGVAAYKEWAGATAWLTIQGKTDLWKRNGWQLQWLQVLKAAEEPSPLSSQAVKVQERLMSGKQKEGLQPNPDVDWQSTATTSFSFSSSSGWSQLPIGWSPPDQHSAMTEPSRVLTQKPEIPAVEDAFWKLPSAALVQSPLMRQWPLLILRREESCLLESYCEPGSEGVSEHGWYFSQLGVTML